MNTSRLYKRIYIFIYMSLCNFYAYVCVYVMSVCLYCREMLYMPCFGETQGLMVLFHRLKPGVSRLKGSSY